MSKSYIIAIIIAGIIGVWLLSGILRDNSSEVPPAESIAKANQEDSLQRVRTTTSLAEPHEADLSLRGRTEAKRKISVRAETQGRIISLPNAKGDQVKKGAVLCKLDQQDRSAQLAEARANLRSRDLELKQAQQLFEKGHRSETAVAAARAQYDSALARLRRIQVEIGNTLIEAPFAGVIEDLPHKTGALLQPGAVCAVLVEEDPFLVTAQLSEGEVSRLHVGDKAVVTLINQPDHEGIVSFIAKSADAATRTFKAEITVPNPDRVLREGMTANIKVGVLEQLAHRVSPDVLTLNDQGQIGVKIVNKKSRVEFIPVEVIDEADTVIYVTGLPQQARLITVGQEFVLDGQSVIAESIDAPSPPVDEPTKVNEPAPAEPAADEPAEMEEPIAEEQADVEEPVPAEPAAEEPAKVEEPAPTEPAAEEPAKVEEPAPAEPAAEEPAKVEEPAPAEPAAEEPAKVEEPAPAEPVTEEPAKVEGPAPAEPAAEEPAKVEEPAPAEPAAKEPAKVEEPTPAEPAAEEPAKVEEPVADEPATEEPAKVEEPAAEEPVEASVAAEEESAEVAPASSSDAISEEQPVEEATAEAATEAPAAASQWIDPDRLAKEQAEVDAAESAIETADPEELGNATPEAPESVDPQATKDQAQGSDS